MLKDRVFEEVDVTTHVKSTEGLKTLVGSHLGYSDYRTVTQEQVNLFADATGDHQWIHVEPERAKTGPFGCTIAHGYLTLSLIPVLLGDVIHVENVKMGVNYGTNKVRFTNPVPVGAEVRAGATLASVEDVTGGVQVTLDVTVEVKDAAKPSCVAQVVFRYYF
jgi:acyl dehydratase